MCREASPSAWSSSLLGSKGRKETGCAPPWAFFLCEKQGVQAQGGQRIPCSLQAGHPSLPSASPVSGRYKQFKVFYFCPVPEEIVLPCSSLDSVGWQSLKDTAQPQGLFAPEGHSHEKKPPYLYQSLPAQHFVLTFWRLCMIIKKVGDLKAEQFYRKLAKVFPLWCICPPKDCFCGTHCHSRLLPKQDKTTADSLNVRRSLLRRHHLESLLVLQVTFDLVALTTAKYSKEIII